jgi:ABC-2 type transport system ATP-binding protein
MTADFVVETRQLAKRYDGRRSRPSVVAVGGIDLTVRRGEIYGFLGPNGAGKTTTLRMLVGLIRPTSGQASVLGRPPGASDALAKIGSIIEGPGFYPYLSGADNLRVVARYAGVRVDRLGPVLEAVDLAGRCDDKFATYSMGMKQRLGVAAALLKDPELVILDEPTNGLDPAGIRDMRTLITDLGRQGRTVILSSHQLAEVQQICDRVAVIDHGRLIAESTVDELRGESELLVSATPSDVARSTLEEMPAVSRVRSVGGDLRVRVDDRHTAAIARQLVLAGVDITQLRRDERELEDVFFEITQHTEHTQSAHDTDAVDNPEEARHV